jgi:hypothetical protein
MDVCCECCVLSGRGLCDGLITSPEESYRLSRVVVCDLETSKTRRLKPATRLWKIEPQLVVTPRKETNKHITQILTLLSYRALQFNYLVARLPTSTQHIEQKHLYCLASTCSSLNWTSIVRLFLYIKGRHSVPCNYFKHIKKYI